MSSGKLNQYLKWNEPTIIGFFCFKKHNVRRIQLRIVFVPVDERFCTRDYFIIIAEAFNIEIATPPVELLGKKKVPADIDGIWRWLETNVKENDLLILSMDMILYGGLIPSRAGVDSYETLDARLEKLKNLKKKGKLYLSSTVTRIPAYNYADEEPVYWDALGLKVNEYSKKIAGFKRGLLKEHELKEAEIEFPTWVLEDFNWRRERNFHYVKKSIELVKEGLVDFLNLTLDDNSEDSLSMYEARLHEKKVKEFGIEDRVSIHPGADEALLSLLGKGVTDYFGYNPEVKIDFSQPDFSNVVPPYEGSPLDVSVPLHLETAGARVVESGEEGILIVHNSEMGMRGEDHTPLNREIYDYAKKLVATGSIAGICDIACANGSDNTLVESILKKEYDWSRLFYSAWNTAGNTIGTVCCGLVLRLLAEKGYLEMNEEKFNEINAIFFLEHWGYQSNIRKPLREEEAPKRGGGLFTLIPLEDWAEDYVYNELEPYRSRIEECLGRNYDYLKPFFPWHRPFEVGFRK